MMMSSWTGRMKMSNQDCSRSEVLYALQEIEKEVIRVLGKYQKNIITIVDKETFHNYVTACISSGIVAIDTETDNSLDPLTCKLMGLCLYAPGLQYAYVPVNHRDPETKVKLVNQLTEEDVKEELLRINESQIKVVAHNGKFDYQVLKCTCGVSVVPYWDTMVAARLLDENESCGLKYQYTSKIDKTQEDYSIEKLFKKVQYSDVKPEIFALYSAVDPFMTYKLYEYQLPIMESENKIFKLFMSIEMPLVVVVAEMELCGALVDLNYCQKLKEKYETKLKNIDEQLSDEIVKIKPLIDKWKGSTAGNEKERVMPPESRIKVMTQEQLEQKYPLYEPSSNLRYRNGKSFASQLKDPINLASPKQLGILLYMVLGAPKVNKLKPQGTGKREIEAIKEEVERRLKENDNLLNSDDKETETIDDIEVVEEHFKVNKKKKKGEEEEKKKKLLGPTTISKYKSLIVICELLSERRMVEKLLTTYLNSIPRLAQHWSDGKVRFHYNQLGARTGRFTSGGVWKFYENDTPITISGLNGQNLPAENHEIRLIFKAEPGRVFVGGDISQQEPKITAHISQDQNMLKVFREGKDIYASIAQSIYHNNYEDNLEFFDKEKTKVNLEGKNRRKTGKTIILATMYGMGPSTVARKLKLGSKEEAQAMIDAYYSQYPDVKRAIETSVKDCKKNGFIEDICGRRRRLPSIQLKPYQTKFIGAPTSEDKAVERSLRLYLEDKEKLSKDELTELRNRVKENKIEIISNDEHIQRAERQTFNARIQGGAASLTKMMMIMVSRDKLINKLGARIVFQIHDELILDCPKENSEDVKKRLQRLMEVSSTNVGVVLPMKCDMTTETRWGEDTMTSELREAYQKLIKKKVENPLEKLCEEFCNFPEESIRQIICSDNEILEFEW